MGLFKHLMTSVLSPAKHCPVDVSMSQFLLLRGAVMFVGDPYLKMWHLPLSTLMVSSAVKLLSAEFNRKWCNSDLSCLLLVYAFYIVEKGHLIALI